MSGSIRKISCFMGWPSGHIVKIGRHSSPKLVIELNGHRVGLCRRNPPRAGFGLICGGHSW